MECKQVKLPETEQNGHPGLRDRGNGETLVKGYKLLVIREINFRDWIYSVVAIVINSVLYTLNRKSSIPSLQKNGNYVR